MKTTTLILGLGQMALGLVGALTCTSFGASFTPVFIAFAVVNMAVGTNAVTGACFGTGGLVRELYAPAKK